MYSWSTACRQCSSYIFIIDLIPGFNRLHKTTARRDEKHFIWGFGLIYKRFDGRSSYLVTFCSTTIFVHNNHVIWAPTLRLRYSTVFNGLFRSTTKKTSDFSRITLVRDTTMTCWFPHERTAIRKAPLPCHDVIMNIYLHFAWTSMRFGCCHK